MWHPIRTLTADGILGQTWNRLMRHIQVTLEVVSVVDDNVPAPPAIARGNIVALTNGAPAGYVHLAQGSMTDPDEWLGVMVENVNPTNSRGICRTANVALVLFSANSAPPVTGDKVSIDTNPAFPGLGLVDNGLTGKHVGIVYDSTMFDGVKYRYAKVELRPCCVNQPPIP